MSGSVVTRDKVEEYLTLTSEARSKATSRAEGAEDDVGHPLRGEHVAAHDARLGRRAEQRVLRDDRDWA